MFSYESMSNVHIVYCLHELWQKIHWKKRKFCSMNGYKNYRDLLDTRIHEVVKNDPSHTKNLSE